MSALWVFFRMSSGYKLLDFGVVAMLNFCHSLKEVFYGRK
jgi:hypothetical protein